jgi:hypothetical protein
MNLFPAASVLFLIDYDGAQLVRDVLKQLLSALPSYRRSHGKTVDWMRSHTETVWNAERLQQTTSPSQDKNEGHEVIQYISLLSTYGSPTPSTE